MTDVGHRLVQVEDGLLRIEQRVRVARLEIGTDVSGPACVYARIQVRHGTVGYLTGDTQVVITGECDLFLPPFALVQASLDRCDVDTAAVAFRAPDGLPTDPMLLPASHPPLRSRDEILDRLRALEHARYAGRAPRPAPLAAAAKAIVDAEYASPLAIGGIAARLRTSPAFLSRVFKQTYGVPPVRYRHHVRVMDALLQFAHGAAPAEVFQEIGFDDLSRFYRVFRKVACAAPGSYRRGKSKSAKT